MTKKQAQIDSKQLGISVVLALALGLGGGYLIGNAVGENHDHDDHASEMAMDDHSHDDGEAHSHDDAEMFMVSADQAPTLSLVVEKDAKSGYNVKLETTDFTFTPESVNEENVIGEGHAHLYVDGEKVGRLYGPYFHYDGDIEGTAMFRATLNANDHSEYATNGSVIDAMTEVSE